MTQQTISSWVREHDQRPAKLGVKMLVRRSDHPQRSPCETPGSPVDPWVCQKDDGIFPYGP